MRLILIVSAIILAACANPYQLKQAQYATSASSCDTQYGLNKDSWKSLGEYEIPNGWQDWIYCHQEAELQQATGTWYYPFALERIAGLRELMEKFKAKEINRPQMNILASKLEASIAQRAQQHQMQMQAANAPYVQAQQVKSQQMIQMGLKMMQGPTPPVQTNCRNTMLGWECSSQ